MDETVVTTIEGMVDGASVEATIATGDTNLSYVRTSEGEWTREPDGEWVRLEMSLRRPCRCGEDADKEPPTQLA